VRAFAAGGGVTLRWVYLVRARPLVPHHHRDPTTTETATG